MFGICITHSHCAYASCHWSEPAPRLQNGTTPLMWAAVAETAVAEILIAKLLIQSKAQINASNKVSGGSVYILWWPGEFAVSIG